MASGGGAAAAAPTGGAASGELLAACAALLRRGFHLSALELLSELKAGRSGAVGTGEGY